MRRRPWRLLWLRLELILGPSRGSSYRQRDALLAAGNGHQQNQCHQQQQQRRLNRRGRWVLQAGVRACCIRIRAPAIFYDCNVIFFIFPELESRTSSENARRFGMDAPLPVTCLFNAFKHDKHGHPRRTPTASRRLWLGHWPWLFCSIGARRFHTGRTSVNNKLLLLLTTSLSFILH